jgi:hypothetical protein
MVDTPAGPVQPSAGYRTREERAVTDNPVDLILATIFAAVPLLALVGLAATAIEELVNRERKARR